MLQLCLAATARQRGYNAAAYLLENNDCPHRRTDMLPNAWYSLTIAAGASSDLPGIYEWRIAGVGSYIGKYTNLTQRINLYSRNINNLLTGKPYRKGNANGFRRIHRALADAVQSAKTIRLIILENPPLEEIYRREGKLIAERGNLNG